MRLFIAVEPPRELQERAVALAGPLRATGAEVKWVPAGNLHYTLKFLGEVDESRVKGIEQRLRALLEGTKAFRVRIMGAGSFGRPRHDAGSGLRPVVPRVLWFSASEGKEELVALMESVGKAFDDVRRDEFAASAHLTIGRVNGPAGGLVTALEGLKDAAVGEFVVREVLLKKSTLTPLAAGSASGRASAGPVYETVANVELA